MFKGEMMPSNTLKVSQLIEHLKRCQREYGDLDCIFWLREKGNLYAFDSSQIVPQRELDDKTLASPALTFRFGRLYEQGPLGETDWNYNVLEAPDGGTEFRCMKRYGGVDIGKREDDDWFVREGSADAWFQLPRAGILAWKVK